MRTSGLFITFEGGEGSGKSTQMRILERRLSAHDIAVRSLREPGGTVLGEKIRGLLLDPSHEGLDSNAELMLYEAARAQLVAEVIEPALDAGEVVLCDRFFDSTTAYQGYARGLSLEHVVSLNLAATSGLRPDRTLVFDIAPAEGLRRATANGAPDRLEGEDMAFHERVRRGFLAIAESEPERVRVVDALGSVDEVAARVIGALADLPPFSALVA